MNTTREKIIELLFAPLIFALFRLRNIARGCVFFPVSPTSRHLGNLASHPLFSRLPYTSRHLFSRVPAPCFPPILWTRSLSTLWYVLHFQSPASKTLVIDKDVTGYIPVHYASRGGYLQVYIPRTCVEYELINN